MRSPYLTELEIALGQRDALKASLAEMVGIYWGDGDGHEPPPACIQRALAALALIVKAANHFDDLVACVRASLIMVDGDGSPPDWDFLRRTLKSAEAKDA